MSLSPEGRAGGGKEEVLNFSPPGTAPLDPREAVENTSPDRVSPENKGEKGGHGLHGGARHFPRLRSLRAGSEMERMGAKNKNHTSFYIRFHI